MSTRRKAKRNWRRCVSRSVMAGPLVTSLGKGGRRGGWGWSRRCVRAAGRANRGLRMPEKDSRPLFFGGMAGGLFEKAFHFFQFNQEEYMARYHKRSNVESTFSAIKRKFGDSVMSKTDTAMTNEVLCKILCHNLTCLIQEQETLGIVPIFWKDEAE